MDHATFLKAIRDLRVYEQAGRRAPHKPLLLLLALGRLQRTGSSRMRFDDAEVELLPLLKLYAPPVKARHQPELPYWHLRSSGLWDVTGAEDLPQQRGGFPLMGALRGTEGSLRQDVEAFLKLSPRTVREAITALLDDHFEDSLHDDILAATGADIEADAVADVPAGQRVRDPYFRKEVMRAYEHRCAVTGIRLALGGTFFGLDAAHIRSHRYGGPGTVENGMALTPTLHRLFDHGAWTLTDDRRSLVSADLVGADDAIENLRSLHGAPIRDPITADARAKPEHSRWHCEADQGGVFRAPALAL